MSLRIKKGDKISVIAGKDKGKTGKVLKFDRTKEKLIAEGINIAKKHARRKSESEQGGIKEIPALIHVSNVMLFCTSCNKGVRFGIKVSDDKTKARICKKCQKVI
ncbi:MAG: 50S ribosomal protein L24 [Candidatus Omnitrophica bacterium]|nr:50S ribosomal protein L24 [Candidatus Omnitrophota bacterium]MCK5288854.1 50S ribosomal protein L24 [Candidatus Omnitrophota bacterium]